MINTQKNEKQEKTPKTESQKVVKNHKKAATHFQAAAKSHLEAAKHHENHNHDLAASSIIEAMSHANRAKKAQKADLKQHTFIK